MSRRQGARTWQSSEMSLRAPWTADFRGPRAHDVAERDAHPDLHGCESGQREAAVRIACRLLADAAVDAIRERVGDQVTYDRPVRRSRRTGINLIPDAMSHELGRRLGSP